MLEQRTFEANSEGRCWKSLVCCATNLNVYSVDTGDREVTQSDPYFTKIVLVLLRMDWNGEGPEQKASKESVG